MILAAFRGNTTKVITFQLTSAVEYSYNVMSISIIDHPVEENTNCQVSGWGATEWRGSMPAKLRKANVSIVHRDICSESYRETLVDGMVCANGRSETGITDVCQGGEILS